MAMTLNSPRSLGPLVALSRSVFSLGSGGQTGVKTDLEGEKVVRCFIRERRVKKK